ncbi:hypothetical protein E2P81_ATG06476 [Venturia nashicola]|uniref:Uncharacterized protein n=1 Tax=Venturia nashicola TaxID=86259 RepID=A0A4Z1P3L9_9PEZI|nr:hypothetical protein E6O75_ATG06641 [Venturia nashicola]TLD28130.1 hypothetical protein E2P81_ATG06476 [Venturia nashicola]
MLGGGIAGCVGGGEREVEGEAEAEAEVEGEAAAEAEAEAYNNAGEAEACNYAGEAEAYNYAGEAERRVWILESSGDASGRMGDKRVHDLDNILSGQHWSRTGVHRSNSNRDMAGQGTGVERRRSF